MEVMNQQPHRGVGIEWDSAGQHLVEHNAESVEVGSSVEIASLLPHRLFRGDVLRSANHQSGTGQSAGRQTLGEFRNPEVQHLHEIASVWQANEVDVVRLDVAMDDS